MLKVRVLPSGEEKELEYEGKVSGLAPLLNLSAQEAIFKVDGKIRPDNYELKGNEEVEVVKVIFGG